MSVSCVNPIIHGSKLQDVFVQWLLPLVISNSTLTLQAIDRKFIQEARTDSHGSRSQVLQNAQAHALQRVDDLTCDTHPTFVDYFCIELKSHNTFVDFLRALK